MEETINIDMDDVGKDSEPIPIKKRKRTAKKISNEVTTITNTTELINCLENERVIVRFIKKPSTMIDNPKHVLYGGMSENATKVFTVPMLRNGSLKNILTNDEKDFLESTMGLPINALSIYNKVDNYWNNYFVRLTKTDTFLNLADPEDYIRYKVLLANEEEIAPNLETLENYPKASYQFVLIRENEESKLDSNAMNLGMEANRLFAELGDDKQSLRIILEIMEGKPTSDKVKLAFLKTQVYKRLNAEPKVFINIVGDPYFKTRVLVKRCVEYKIIAKRGDFYYNSKDFTPLCKPGDDPVIINVLKYLNNPANQELKLTFEALLKSKEE